MADGGRADVEAVRERVNALRLGGELPECMRYRYAGLRPPPASQKNYIYMEAFFRHAQVEQIFRDNANDGPVFLRFKNPGKNDKGPASPIARHSHPLVVLPSVLTAL